MTPSEDWVFDSMLKRWRQDFSEASEQRVWVPSYFGLSNVNASIAFWAKPASATEGGAFVKLGSGEPYAEGDGYAIGVGGSNFDNTGNDIICLFEQVRWIDTGTTIGTDWAHLILELDASGVPSIYKNGVLINSYAGDNANIPGSASTPTHGTSIGGYGLNGGTLRYVNCSLADVIIHGRNLSAGEKQALADPSNVMLSGLIMSPRRSLWPVVTAAPASISASAVCTGTNATVAAAATVRVSGSAATVGTAGTASAAATVRVSASGAVAGTAGTAAAAAAVGIAASSASVGANATTSSAATVAISASAVCVGANAAVVARLGDAAAVTYKPMMFMVC
jgi:hypothetical protein